MPTELPEPDVNATVAQVNDGESYAIEISGEIEAGQNIVRIQNVSDAPHLVEFVGLSQTLDRDQIFALMATPDGEAPDPAANIPADIELEFSSLYAATQSSGTTQWLIGTFDTSEYLAACWIPVQDDTDLVHAQDGEFTLFTVE